MRRKACLYVVAAVAAVVSVGVLAQAPGAPPPLPASAMPPPMPSGTAPPVTTAGAPQPLDYSADPDEPQVTIIRKDYETVEEVRVGGTLKYVRVTPRHGRTYYLVPSGNGQTFNRMDSLGGGLSVPMWLLFSW